MAEEGNQLVDAGLQPVVATSPPGMVYSGKIEWAPVYYYKDR